MTSSGLSVIDDLNRLTAVVEKNSSNVTLSSQTYTLNHNGTRASSTENEVQPDGSKVVITSSWLYDALGRLTRESVQNSYLAGSTTSDGLANTLWLPSDSAYAELSGDNTSGGAELTWDGTEYTTGPAPVVPSSSNGYAFSNGAMLVGPLAGIAYGGNGLDWVLITVDESGNVNEWSLTLADGTFTPDGQVMTYYSYQSITLGTFQASYTDFYSYDLSSNRMKKMHTGTEGDPSQTITYTYNANDELVHQASTLAGQSNLTYDNNGSLLSETSTTPQYGVGLDESFGSGGILTAGGSYSTVEGSVVMAGRGYGYGGSADYMTEAGHHVLANGDIVMVGNGNSGCALYEFNPDGSLNTSFGTGGLATLTLSGATTIHAITDTPDGQIILAGTYDDGSSVKPFLAEFLANGALNTSFGTLGIVLTSISNGAANAVMALADGDILTAGSNGAGGGLLAEYHANGTLDTSFNTTGIVTTSSGTAWSTLTTLSNGTIVVAGAGKVAEYNANGTLLTTFGTAGIMTTGLSQIAGLTTLANGELLVAGSLSNGSNVLEKITAAGSADTTFGASGLTTMPSIDGGTPAALSVLASGDILVTGSSFDSGTYATSGWLVEYKSDGTLDTTFGNQGTALLPLNGWGNSHDMTLLANGEVLAGGTLTLSTGSTYMFLAKYKVSGSPTSYANTTQTTTYTYDVRGKLTSVSVNGNVEATYTYDDQGNRVSETVGGVTTLYLNDTMNPTGYAEPIEAKTSATGKPTTTWITGDRVFAQADANGNVSYLLADGHGSTRLLTNAQGTVLATYNYDAFGGALNFNPGMARTPFLYGGDAFYDAPSGLYVHGNGTRARLGFFFIERDFGIEGQGSVQNPLTLHKYVYVLANPVNKADRNGHDVAEGEDAAIGLITGAVVAGVVTLLQEFSYRSLARLFCRCCGRF